MADDTWTDSQLEKDWLAYNKDIRAFLNKSKIPIEEAPNVHKFADILIEIHFVNDRYLSLILKFKDRQIMDLRLPEYKKENGTRCTSVLAGALMLVK